MNKRMIQMLAIVLVIVGLLGFVKYRQISAAMAGNKGFQMPPEAVTTVVAQAAEWSATIDAVGSVAPIQGVVLSADLADIVIHLGLTMHGGQRAILLAADEVDPQIHIVRREMADRIVGGDQRLGAVRAV